MSPVQFLKWLTILLAVVGVLGLVTYAIWMSRAASAEPAERVSSQMVVEAARGVGRLELTHYRLKVTQAAEFNTPMVFGMMVIPRKSKVLVIASGEAIGCIDFAKLDSGAVVLADSSIQLTLPAPELCSHRVIMNESEVYSAEYSLLLFNDDAMKASLIKSAFTSAEKSIEAAALKQGILEETNKQAAIFLRPLLQKFGFKRVDVRTTPPAADR